jgi:hypothetical protein
VGHAGKVSIILIIPELLQKGIAIIAESVLLMDE